MKEKVIELGERKYILRQFSIQDKINIRDNSLDTFGNVKLGTFQFNALLASLKSWNYQMKDGTPIPITEANIKTHLEIEHFDLLVVEAVALNELMITEKKTLSRSDVGQSGGANETIIGK